jgi:hypothetical protein
MISLEIKSDHVEQMLPTSSAAYSELAKGKWHVLLVASDLDKDRTKLAEDPSDFRFEDNVRLQLGQAIHVKSVFGTTQKAKANVLGDKDAGRRRIDSLSVNGLRAVVECCCELTSSNYVRGVGRAGLGKQASMRRDVGKDVIGRHGVHLECGGFTV